MLAPVPLPWTFPLVRPQTGLDVVWAAEVWDLGESISVFGGIIAFEPCHWGQRNESPVL